MPSLKHYHYQWKWKCYVWHIKWAHVQGSKQANKRVSVMPEELMCSWLICREWLRPAGGAVQESKEGKAELCWCNKDHSHPFWISLEPSHKLRENTAVLVRALWILIHFTASKLSAFLTTSRRPKTIRRSRNPPVHTNWISASFPCPKAAQRGGDIVLKQLDPKLTGVF